MLFVPLCSSKEQSGTSRSTPLFIHIAGGRPGIHLSRCCWLFLILLAVSGAGAFGQLWAVATAISRTRLWPPSESECRRQHLSTM